MGNEIDMLNELRLEVMRLRMEVAEAKMHAQVLFCLLPYEKEQMTDAGRKTLNAASAYVRKSLDEGT